MCNFSDNMITKLAFLHLKIKYFPHIPFNPNFHSVWDPSKANHVFPTSRPFLKRVASEGSTRAACETANQSATFLSPCPTGCGPRISCLRVLYWFSHVDHMIPLVGAVFYGCFVRSTSLFLLFLWVGNPGQQLIPPSWDNNLLVSATPMSFSADSSEVISDARVFFSFRDRNVEVVERILT